MTDRVVVQRGDSTMRVVPDSVPFWESKGYTKPKPKPKRTPRKKPEPEVDE